MGLELTLGLVLAGALRARRHLHASLQWICRANLWRGVRTPIFGPLRAAGKAFGVGTRLLRKRRRGVATPTGKAAVAQNIVLAAGRCGMGVYRGPHSQDHRHINLR